MEELVVKYIRKCAEVIEHLEASGVKSRVDEKVRYVIELAKQYLRDAEFYRSEGRLDVSLASVSYSEGLLDALRLLGLIEFEW